MYSLIWFWFECLGFFVCGQDNSATVKCGGSVQQAKHSNSWSVIINTQEYSNISSMHTISNIHSLSFIITRGAFSCFTQFFFLPGEQVQNLNLRIIIVFTAGTPSVQTVGTKVGTPVSLTGQRFTVQIPSSQAASVKSGKFLPQNKQFFLYGPYGTFCAKSVIR